MGIFQRFSKEFVQTIRSALRKVEGELNEHLESINANTNEIQSVYELLAEMDMKMDKLSSRVDHVQMLVEGTSPEQEFTIEPLTRKEKDVFIVLYMNNGMTYTEVAKRLHMEEVMAQEYVTNLIAKGVPLTKKFQNNTILIALDKEFKEQQAKKQIIKFNDL